LHNSYIIVQTPTWMQILDQHALAERIIYEKLIKEKKDFSIQWLLIWESIKLTTKELEIVEKYKEIFEEMWFEFEILDAWIIIISAIPDFVKKEDLTTVFTWIINDIWEIWFTKSKTLEEVKNKIFAYTACRSAIKFWNKLTLFEMNKLLNDAVLTYSSTCPHWRPVVYEINLDELKGKYER
jgi:DNA mismatch repair protein MutL